MISSSFWEGKVDGVKPLYLPRLRHRVYSIRKRNFKRICVATAVSETLLVSSGHYIKEYENRENYFGFYAEIGTIKVSIEYMQSFKKHNASEQYEFDLGIIKVSRLRKFN